MNTISDDLALATIEQSVERITALGEEYERVQAEMEEAYAHWELLGTRLGEMSEMMEKANS